MPSHAEVGIRSALSTVQPECLTFRDLMGPPLLRLSLAGLLALVLLTVRVDGSTHGNRRCAQELSIASDVSIRWFPRTVKQAKYTEKLFSASDRTTKLPSSRWHEAMWLKLGEAECMAISFVMNVPAISVSVSGNKRGFGMRNCDLPAGNSALGNTRKTDYPGRAG